MPTLSRREWLNACVSLPIGASSIRGVQRSNTPRESPDAGQPAWALGPFTRETNGEPILAPRDDTRFTCPVRGAAVAWEQKNVLNPAAVVRNGAVHLLYRAQDVGGTSRIGLATSRDGIRFNRRLLPVLFPDNDGFRSYEWEGGCEDPRVVETADGGYVVTYTAYDGKIARLCVASSPDLIAWTKHGPAFMNAGGGRFRDRWSKSGAIVCELRGDRLVATRIGGLYWMYWGDTDIFLASSEDLLNWTPVERASEPGQNAPLVSALTPRGRRFDSALVEPGPPAMITASGILLLYNSANRRAIGDPTLPDMAYSAGQALFDPNDPGAIVGRTTAPFLRVSTEHEIRGQVGNVCFVEGLVRVNGRWLLYYGMGDSKIGVASASALGDRVS